MLELSLRMLRFVKVVVVVILLLIINNRIFPGILKPTSSMGHEAMFLESKSME